MKSASSSALILSACAAVSLAAPPPKPFTPPGGLGTNGSLPVYKPLSDFDTQSLVSCDTNYQWLNAVTNGYAHFSVQMVVHQEFIKLDLFHHGLAQFSAQEFEAAGLTADDRFLIEHMADQEVGHAKAISDMLGPNAFSPCTYQYNFTTLEDHTARRVWDVWFLGAPQFAGCGADFVSIESRQQMALRHFEGLFLMPEWFEPEITQSMQWTPLAPYIKSCPVGREIFFAWELPGKQVGWNNSDVTNTTAGEPKFVAWISQLNTTYTPLTNVSGQSGQTIQPSGNISGKDTAAIVNSTMLVAITDANITVAPSNTTALNAHIVAGPACYVAG
ncbi:hypothetical protein CVT26_014511 [Gymnopilus dilepis]|uniref:Rds1 protein n=1 Tax=Gymnopilus dilepis TaxID=231916 RepID=A0A409W3E3_9AGAR|nr:hypothetical protein CVT26_014511 [Gymnopilus dilepis]